jgi:hypothetical protein
LKLASASSLYSNHFAVELFEEPFRVDKAMTTVVVVNIHTNALTPGHKKLNNFRVKSFAGKLGRRL